MRIKKEKRKEKAGEIMSRAIGRDRISFVMSFHLFHKGRYIVGSKEKKQNDRKSTNKKGEEEIR